eukprot:EG_transcript_17998
MKIKNDEECVPQNQDPFSVLFFKSPFEWPVRILASRPRFAHPPARFSTCRLGSSAAFLRLPVNWHGNAVSPRCSTIVFLQRFPRKKRNLSCLVSSMFQSCIAEKERPRGVLQTFPMDLQKGRLLFSQGEAWLWWLCTSTNANGGPGRPNGMSVI